MQGQEKYTPNYMKIQNYISQKIESGEYQEGTKIPSETEFAEMFSVSRITANKAIKEMSVLGILNRVQGRGTFVSAKQPVSTQSKAFVSAAKLTITGVRRHHLLRFRILNASPELAAKANLPVDEPFYEIIMSNESGERAESLDFTYIPCTLIKDITPSLEYLQTHFVMDCLKALPNIIPKFMKIFVNVPQYDFLRAADELLGDSEGKQIWCTEIYDATMVLLGATYTVHPGSAQDIPLFTFAL